MLSAHKALIASFGLLVLLALILGGPGLFYSLSLRLAPYTAASYALYLDDGNVLYGRIRGVGFGYLILKDVWSFQSLTVGGSTTSNLAPQVANGLTSPNNFLMVNRSHILFIEQMGKNAKVLKLGTREP